MFVKPAAPAKSVVKYSQTDRENGTTRIDSRKGKVAINQLPKAEKV